MPYLRYTCNATGIFQLWKKTNWTCKFSVFRGNPCVLSVLVTSGNQRHSLHTHTQNEASCQPSEEKNKKSECVCDECFGKWECRKYYFYLPGTLQDGALAAKFPLQPKHRQPSSLIDFLHCQSELCPTNCIVRKFSQPAYRH